MNSLLLDTHAFIWFLENDSHLPVATRQYIESADTVFVSIASLWEIAIKLSIGKIALQSAYETIEAGLDNAGLTLLQISFADTLLVRHLPLHHRDPFDRIIVAQAIDRDLLLVSRDRNLDSYQIQRLWK